ncbi:MAG: acyl carrier protein [Hyphomonadaceae bacterium]|nr:acyl carrier protein [Hyphomonadaceae bacterium]
MADSHGAPMNIAEAVRGYILHDLFLGAQSELADDASLLEAGALDSTAAMELVAFLETTFNLKVADEEISVENLDTVSRIARFVERKISV